MKLYSAILANSRTKDKDQYRTFIKTEMRLNEIAEDIDRAVCFGEYQVLYDIDYLEKYPTVIERLKELKYSVEKKEMHFFGSSGPIERYVVSWAHF